MYGLLMRIPNGLEPLRKKFEEHVKLSGCAAVQKIMPTPVAGAESSKTESVVIYAVLCFGSGT
jgi:cullin 1